jgi:SAM-dependent methyltransferase
MPFVPLEPKAPQAVDFRGLDVPTHLTPTLLSHFPQADAPGALALDLGCGDGVHRDVVERCGFEWVGIDYFEPQAPILADGHALPFADNTFDFILSIAVLEHIRYPFVVVREALRVLKPGGRLIGTVAFLEPFHQDSYYHHTHLGTLNSLRYGGFDVEIVASDPSWRVLDAQAHMALFPGLPNRFSRLLVSPLDLVHRLWWRLAALARKDMTRARRVRMTGGAFTFIATKPAHTVRR